MLLSAIALAGAVPIAEAWVIVEHTFQLDEGQFQSWVYGGRRNNVDPISEIAVTVEAVHRTCNLTEAQLEKLRLAGRGDFARFLQQVDVMRAKYVGKAHDQNDVGRIHQEIQTLNTTYRNGLLGDSSLFAKVLRNMLTPEQWASYEADQKARLRARHETKVRLHVAALERRCPLTDSQRKAIVDLLLAETEPPIRSSQWDQYVVLVQAARISEEQYRKILDEDQYAVLVKTLERARVYEQHLKQQGVLP